MNLESILSERLSKLKLFSLRPQWAEESVNEFVEVWRELGCEIIEQQLQAQFTKVQVSSIPKCIRPHWAR